MKLFDRAIDRPLPVFLAAGVIVLLGVYSVWRLPVNRAPRIEIPYTLVFATWEGAAPIDVESELTEPLEERLNTLDDLRHMTSMSREGLSVHYLEFADRTDMTESLRDARDQADLAEVDFPDDADPAVVQELSFDDEPIVFFTLSGSSDLFALRDIAEDLKPELESIAGVSAVEIFGGHEREVRVHADPITLAHHGLTLEGLAQAVREQSRNIPAGELRTAESQRLIRSTGEFSSLEEIRGVTVANETAGPIALRDVASVELAHRRLTSGAWWNGEPSVTLIVRRQPRVNTLETVDRLRERVDALRLTLPAGIEISASADQSEDIGQMLSQLGRSALFGLVLVVALLLAVFGWRQALLVASVLPFALLFTSLGLYVFDMGVSNIALFALILVLGLVVDGAIIVGEAIFAEQEAGARPKEAAKIGIGRVGMPVITADFTTIAAFAPMLLMVGVMGQFMSVLPKVVIFALLGSVFVDHLVLPAAAARLKSLPGARRPSRVARHVDRARDAYLRVLASALSHRKKLLAGSALAFACALGLFGSGTIESIFLPSVDRGRFTLNYELPLGSSLEETSRVGRLLARHLEALPELEHYTLTTGETGALASGGDDGGRIGPEYGRLTVELVPTSERRRTQSAVIDEVRTETSRYAGVNISLDQPEGGPPTGAALAIRIKGEELESLSEANRQVRERLATLPGAVGIRSDYDPGKPEIRVDLDRPRAAAEHGITPEQVSRSLLIAFHGFEVGRMWSHGERVDIRVQAPPEYAHTVGHVEELPLRSNQGGLVPLGEVAGVSLGFSHNAIFRHDTMRTATIRADAAEGVSSVALEADARTALDALSTPEGVTIEFGGETEERDRSYASLWDALKWGALLIYVIIAIQFDSLRQPLIVLLTVPLSFVGVTLGLLLTGTPFSFMVFIGIVSLTGIVVNDGIVLVDSINARRRAGMPLTDAVQAAAGERFRPVLLTTVTTIAGLLPLTVGLSDGGEFWRPLGIAIISGLVVASMLTLLVAPSLYVVLEGGRARRRSGQRA